MVIISGVPIFRIFTVVKPKFHERFHLQVYRSRLNVNVVSNCASFLTREHQNSVHYPLKTLDALSNFLNVNLALLIFRMLLMSQKEDNGQKRLADSAVKVVNSAIRSFFPC